MRIIVISLAGCLALAGCGQASDVSTGSPAPQSVKPAPSHAHVDKQAAFLTALSAIDPQLTSNKERAMRRAANLCLDIKEGKAPATVAKGAQLRFTGGDVTVNAAQAKQIVAAAKRYVC